ncbi:TPA: hypothetical protein N0F65_012778 [Lagenidium giganteum]|uniref:PA domain-containing protein n=1 Tax=Lagenidium giganteum TaxID=4803 RepID=A0AAV2YGQ2_9STRA|nr:TPA: hypothetical protein N0F65_012778 [Lagenidium giganteum]
MGGTADDELDTITIPCVMMCLQDVRDLFKFIPPSVKDGQVLLELLPLPEAKIVAEECLKRPPMQNNASEAGRGWGGFMRKTSSIMKVLGSGSSSASVPLSTTTPLTDSENTTTAAQVAVQSVPMRNAPLFAFVQWSTNADSYHLCYAPLSDFCLAANNAVYGGELAVCDPLLAHETLRNCDALVDRIALVQRGKCTFPAKLERIQKAGAVAALVGNDDTDNPDTAFVMSVDQIRVDHLTMPSAMVSFNVFQRLLCEQPTTVRLLCFSGEAAALFLTKSMDDVNLKSVPEPTTDKQVLRAFLSACRDGRLDACHQAIEQYCGNEAAAQREFVRQTDSHLLTALHHACVGGNEHIVSLLLRIGAVAGAMDVAMQTPLHYACLYGHHECVQRLIQATTAQAPGSPSRFPLAANVGGATPLHYACWSGSTECLELLLTTLARVSEDGNYIFDGVDARDNDGCTPLHVACRKAFADCAMYLIAANADVDLKDNAGVRPLQIACDLINDPECSRDALHLIEKLMAAGADMREEQVAADSGASAGTMPGTDDSIEGLVLDRIESKTLKRELEVAYLRYAAQRLQRRWSDQQRELDRMSKQVHALQEELVDAKLREESAHRLQAEQARVLHRQQSQMEQLQLQMKSILQFLQAQPMGVVNLAYSVSSASAEPSVPSGEEVMSDTSDLEQERALEAALARDMGRKFCRERKYALAESHFAKSLELFALPGVQRMLDHARGLRLAHDEHAAVAAKQQKIAQSKEQVLAQFRQALAQSHAPDHAIKSIENELHKLATLEEHSTEYMMAQKWLAWLLSLPWGDPLSNSSESTSLSPCTNNFGLFQRIESLDQAARRRKQSQAARTIQAAFREHYSVHLLRRATAATRLQAMVRGTLARRRWPHVRRELQSAKARAVTARKVSLESNKATRRSNLGQDEVRDWSRHVDPMCVDRLNGKKSSIVIGVHLVDTDTRSCIVQLVRALPALKWQPQVSVFYVWHRWTEATEAQATLSGPFDDETTARRRYDREIQIKVGKGFRASDHSKSPVVVDKRATAY